MRVGKLFAVYIAVVLTKLVITVGVLACDTLFGFIATGCDRFLLPPALLNQTGRLGMVNRSRLKKRNAKNISTCP